MGKRLLRTWFLLVTHVLGVVFVFFMWSVELGYFSTLSLKDEFDNSTYAFIVLLSWNVICLFGVLRLFLFLENAFKIYLIGLSIWGLDAVYHIVRWGREYDASYFIGFLLFSLPVWVLLLYLVRSAEQWNKRERGDGGIKR